MGKSLPDDFLNSGARSYAACSSQRSVYLYGLRGMKTQPLRWLRLSKPETSRIWILWMTFILKNRRRSEFTSQKFRFFHPHDRANCFKCHGKGVFDLSWRFRKLNHHLKCKRRRWKMCWRRDLTAVWWERLSTGLSASFRKHQGQRSLSAFVDLLLQVNLHDNHKSLKKSEMLIW